MMTLPSAPKRGSINFAIKDAAFAMFVLLFYKQVLGLSGSLTGLAIFISVLWDAVSDPLVGAWSDRLHTRWGRRHPMLLAGALPLGLSFVMLFHPPDFVLGTQWPLFGWLLEKYGVPILIGINGLNACFAIVSSYYNLNVARSNFCLRTHRNL